MNGLLFRPAISEDLPCLAGIERAAAALFPPGRVPDPDSTLPVHLLQTALAQGLLFVATLDDEVVAFAICEAIDGYLHLAEVSVHPTHGRQGIGRALVERVIAESRTRSLEGVTLTTFADISWNAPFYRRVGFVEAPGPAALPHVRAHLQAEAAAGMTERVGMFYALHDDGGPGSR